MDIVRRDTLLWCVSVVLLLCCISPAALGDTFTITCPSYKIDVKNGPVNYTCTLTLKIPAGINTYQVTASLGDYTVNPVNGYVDNVNITSINVSLIFQLAQYAPNGTYAVSAYAVGYSNGVNVDYSTTFVVATTVNDNLPPTLVKVYAPPVNISNPSAAYVEITAYDDLSKFDQVQVVVSSVSSGANAIGETIWIASGAYDKPISLVQNGTNIRITLPITFYSSLYAGYYLLQVTLCDIFRHCVVISSDQLQQKGLQYELNVGPTTIRDGLTFSCPQTAYDVSKNNIVVSCALTLQYASGIQYYQVYASQTQGNDVLRLQTPNGDYWSTNSTTTRISTNVTFQLLRYQPAGIYAVTVQSQGFNGAFLNGMATITVANTTNDKYPPVVTYVNAPAVSVNAKSIPVQLVVSDDLGGVGYIYVAIIYQYQAYADVRWYVPANSTAPTNLNISLVMQAFANLPNRTYDLAITVSDVFGRTTSYTRSDLQSKGLQSYVVVSPAAPASSSCAAGTYKQYSASSSDPCLLCPIGTYSEAGAFRCTACMPGYFSTVNGSSACNPCPAGTTGIGGSWACSACPAGYVAPSPGQILCTPCDAGYTSSSGATACTQCASGTYTVKGKGGCNPCPKGAFASTPSDYCYPCPPGTFANVTGSSQCAPCPANTFASGGFTDCTACDGGKLGPAGSNSKLNCYYN